MTDTQLQALSKEVKKLCTEKGWRNEQLLSNPYAFGSYIALLHSEVSEALDAYLDKQWSETREDGKPIGVGPELADVFIRLLDMCDIWNINLEHEITRVLKYGWTRPYQHGGRVL